MPSLTLLICPPDYMLAEIAKFPVDWSDLTSDTRKSALPARHIYEIVLPEVVDRLHGKDDVYYHRSSPYSIPGKSTMDLTYGDLHNCKRGSCYNLVVNAS